MNRILTPQPQRRSEFTNAESPESPEQQASWCRLAMNALEAREKKDRNDPPRISPPKLLQQDASPKLFRTSSSSRHIPPPQTQKQPTLRDLGKAFTPNSQSLSPWQSPTLSRHQQNIINSKRKASGNDDDDDDDTEDSSSVNPFAAFQSNQGDDDDDDDDFDKTQNNRTHRNTLRSNQSKEAKLGFSFRKDPDFRPGVARSVVAPDLARLAVKIQQTGKDRMINSNIDFRDWNLEEMLAAEQQQQAQQSQLLQQQQSKNSFSSHSFDGSNENAGGGGNSAELDDDAGISEGRRSVLRHTFEHAFQPLKIDPKEILKGRGDTLRTNDQKVMFLRKRLLMEEAAKRRASVRYVREITHTLRADEKLFESFTAEVRSQQLQRLKEHRAAQELLDNQRKIFLDRTPQQRVTDFLRVEEMRAQKVEQSRLEQEETFLAYCENTLAMRRGASFSRQYAWMPIIIVVLRALFWSSTLRKCRASSKEEKILQAAKRDFHNVFVPTRVTGFLRLAQGYKDAAKKQQLRGNNSAGGGGNASSPDLSRFSKQDQALQVAIRNKKQYYQALKRQELDHPQWAFDVLFAKLRELQFPILLMRFARRRRHRSANVLVAFLRTLFQQTSIRVRCKCYLRYVRNVGQAWLQAIKNRRTRRNFVWVLQFKKFVEERRMYDLPTCVEADHVLKRRERIRQRFAYDVKRAYETVDALRKRLVAAAAHSVAATAAAAKESAEEAMSQQPPNAMSPTRVGSSTTAAVTTGMRPMSPMSDSGPSRMSRPDTASPLSTSPPTSPIRGQSATSNVNNNNVSSVQNTSMVSALSPSVLSQSPTAPHPTNDVDICRILCAPVMVPHPYGRFGPAPREAALVARATMDTFRVTEIKWMPSDAAMHAILDCVLKIEDRAVFAQYQAWLRINKQHRERADFIASVLSHVRYDAPQRVDLEAQYKELLQSKPLPPRQPYVLPDSEMRILVHAAYTLTAHEKRAVIKKAGEIDGSPSSESVGRETSKDKQQQQQHHPVFNEANVKLHIARAAAQFEGLHGNVRPFLLQALMERLEAAGETQKK